MMGLQTPAVAWDRSMVLPSPSTLAGRFAQDGRSAAKARAWVEEVIGERLPPGTFGDALKNGIGLCQLINAIQPGTITKIDTSTSPFKQMANISAFIQSCRKLGVREHALFETLVSGMMAKSPYIGCASLFSIGGREGIILPD